MSEPRRYSDQVLFEMKGELGALREGADRAEKDREQLFEEVRHTNKSLQALTLALQPLPEMQATVKTHGTRLGTLETAEVARRSKIIGLSLGAGLAGGVGLPEMFKWLQPLFRKFGG